ncbi:hypothetical protein CRE_30363 [Caenorhabditis remanei]|uniref:Uncharacterized protein n=1 Tax=Caenorhabditis remanei TaxID=31234 RepID=E3N5Z6_CAERE|nr:hypothetical protein CRE_30363 [Caenorhabditis remanei]
MDKNRNLQWIFLIFVISQHAVICQKLTENENLIRLRDCGHQFLPQPSQNGNNVSIDYTNKTVRNSVWLSWVTQLPNTKELDFKKSAAFPISSRHIFTSSQVVLTANKTWAYDGVSYKGCKKEIGYVDVPENTLKNLNVSSGGRRVEVLKGRIFACDRTDLNRTYHPLLLETEPLNLRNIPCLADDETIKYNQDAEVHAYGLEGDIMAHRKLRIELKDRPDNTWVCTQPRYFADNSRGGPLVMNVSGKATVIGLKGAAVDDPDGTNYFYNMAVLQDKICEYSGVCFVKNVTEALAKLTTTEAPVTKAPEDGGLSQNTPNRAGNNETPQRSASEDSEIPRRPSPDADESEEQKKPTYSEVDEEEDTDILLDKDFNKGTRFGEHELLFVFLFLVLMI